jgi:hypothetical protein
VKFRVEQPETHRDTKKKSRRTLRQTGTKLFICKDRSLSRAGTVGGPVGHLGQVGRWVKWKRGSSGPNEWVR